MPDNDKPQRGRREKRNPSLDDAIREAMGVEPGSDEDEALDDEARAAQEAEREAERQRVLDGLLHGAARLTRGSSDGVDHILRVAHNSSLTEGQLAVLIYAINTATGLGRRVLAATNKRIREEVKEARQRRIKEEVERQRARYEKKGGADPHTQDVYGRFGLPIAGTVFREHRDKLWAGKLVDNDGQTVFLPLHTPWKVDGQEYLPPDEVEGLRLAVLHSSDVVKSIRIRLGQLHSSIGRNDVMSLMASAGLRCTNLGREAILEQLSTHFHTHTFRVDKRAGFNFGDGVRRFTGPTGKIIEHDTTAEAKKNEKANGKAGGDASGKAKGAKS